MPNPATDNSISQIESLIKDTIIFNDIILYKYCSHSETLDIINSKSDRPFVLEDSFLKYTIKRQKIKFDNNITNNKYYNPKIDDPKDLEVRGVMVVPIIEEGETIGILAIYRNDKLGIKFTKKDKRNLKGLAPMLLDVITNESEIEDYSYIQKLEFRLEKEKQEKLELKSQIKEYMLQEIESNKTIEELEKEITELKKDNKKQKSLEDENSELKADIIEKKIQIKKYESDIIKTKNNQRKISSKFENIEKNIEFLPKEVSLSFDKYHNAYTMFEAMIYAISSDSGMDTIDSFISQTKGFDKFINLFYSDTAIRPNRQKFQIKNIFDSSMRDSITLDKNLPVSLVIDAPKIDSILYHILENLLLHKADNSLIKLNISYDKKILYITLSGKIQGDSGLLNSLFKQKSSVRDKDNKDMIIASKLIKIIGAKLHSDYDDKEYNYRLEIPAKVLDLKFVS